MIFLLARCLFGVEFKRFCAFMLCYGILDLSRSAFILLCGILDLSQ